MTAVERQSGSLKNFQLLRVWKKTAASFTFCAEEGVRVRKVIIMLTL